MEKIIYSKFSNDRSPSLNIITEIVESEGRKLVKKTSSSPESASHIRNIKMWSDRLTKRFEHVEMEVSEAILENDTLYFNYIDGKTLEDVLDEYLLADDKEGFLKAVQSYVAKINKAYEVEPFQATNEFVEVFGEIDFAGEMGATRELDIDLIFSNIILSDGRWIVIDYEWTFDFPIPIKYLFYRTAVIYSLNSPKRKEFCGGLLMDLFNITRSEVVCFETMERNLQRNYILNSTHYPLNQLYHEFGKEKVATGEYLEKLRRESRDFQEFANESICNVQVFYDYGDDFSEKNSETFVTNISRNNEVSLELDVPKEVTRIRIDPGEKYCVISSLACYVMGANQKLEVESNAVYKLDDRWIFNNDDPYYVINLESDRAEKIRLTFKIDFISEEAKEWFNEYLNHQQPAKNIFTQIRERDQQILKKSNEVEEKKYLLALENQKYLIEVAKNEEMINSRSWRLTKPLRWLGERVRALKNR